MSATGGTMGNKDQVNLVVDTDMKEEWQRVAKEDPEYNSLSHLIKLAVVHELREGRPDGGGEGDSEAIGEMKEIMLNVQDEVRQLRAGLQQIRQDVTRGIPDTDARVEIFGELPVIRIDEYDSHDPAPDVLEKAVTLETLQDRLPMYSRETIHDILSSLAEETGQVGVVWEDDGVSVKYFKEG